MSEKDQQETLLMAIEYLKAQYESLQNPCIALLISRYTVYLQILILLEINGKSTSNTRSHGLLVI